MHVLNGNSAELRFRREDFVIGVNGHDVVELGNRPVWPDFALRTVVDWILSAQSVEKQANCIFLKKARP